LHAVYAAAVPQAWTDLVTRQGVTAESIRAIATIEEAAAVAWRLDQADATLRRWMLSLQEWIAETAGGSSATSGNEPAHAPMATLERRYELLLRLGAIDRRPLQQRTAAAIREGQWLIRCTLPRWMRRHCWCVAILRPVCGCCPSRTPRTPTCW
jgi:hypothetical protein